jgi:hypothetical protein
MTETTDTNDTDAISWLRGADESAIDGASCTLKGGSVLGGEVVRNLVDVALNTDV